MSERSFILLSEGTTTLSVEAVLIDGVSVPELEETDTIWQRHWVELLQLAQLLGVPESAWPEHLHWEWRGKPAYLSDDVRSFGIECGGSIQGLMFASPSGYFCHATEQAAMPLVYIDYLAVAPWNYADFLLKVGRRPQYRKVGYILLTVAILLSRELGFDGRIGLHSLPQAETFYAGRCGMIDMGIEVMGDGEYLEELRYFEMTPTIARNFLGEAQ